MTSRHTIVELIELIAEHIATASHYEELISQYKSDRAREEDELVKKSYEFLISNTEELLVETTETRRLLMKMLEKNYGSTINKHYRCLVKHTIGIRQFSKEYYLGLGEDGKKEFGHFKQSAYENMIKTVSIFLGLDEVVNCGRCLADQIDLSSQK